MDDLADILAKIHTKENADADWKFITKQIREMPPYRVPQLWGALLQNLARDPPVMPPGYTTSDQWLSMCQAQYHELYRCACKDAGMEGTSVGNLGPAFYPLAQRFQPKPVQNRPRKHGQGTGNIIA